MKRNTKQGGAIRWQLYRAFAPHVCSCIAHAPSRLCHHTLAVQLHMGERQLPMEHDDTEMAMAKRSPQRKAPGRYAVPLAPDEKDKEIAKLKRQLALVQCGTVLRKPAAATASSQRNSFSVAREGTECQECKSVLLQGLCCNHDCSICLGGRPFADLTPSCPSSIVSISQPDRQTTT